MRARIVPVTYERAKDLVGRMPDLTSFDVKCLLRCSQVASRLWVGTIDGKVVCLLGLVPPTLIADYAYLWMHVTDDLKGNEFIFVRHSQMAIQKALEHFTRVIGHCEVSNRKARKWIEWMGGAFGKAHGKLIPFTFERKDD